jgi:hypothetical protein
LGLKEPGVSWAENTQMDLPLPPAIWPENAGDNFNTTGENVLFSRGVNWAGVSEYGRIYRRHFQLKLAGGISHFEKARLT